MKMPKQYNSLTVWYILETAREDATGVSGAATNTTTPNQDI